MILINSWVLIGVTSSSIKIRQSISSYQTKNYTKCISNPQTNDIPLKYKRSRESGIVNSVGNYTIQKKSRKCRK